MPRRRPNIPDKGYSQTVYYDSRNHLKTIFQLYGSIWGSVLPHCLLTVCVTCLLLYLLRVQGLDPTMSEYGHEVMSVLVAFLIISRFTITLSLYFELRGFLSTMYQATIECVQLTAVLTQDEHDLKAREWRCDVAYHSMLLLRVTAAMLTRSNKDGVEAFQVSELSDTERRRLARVVPEDYAAEDDVVINSQRWVQDHGSLADENLRVPVRMAHRLRSVIMSHRTHSPTIDLDAYEEQNILSCVKDFMNAYYGIRKYLTTPLPFPLVQMARVFLFAYVYTLPFALLNVLSKPVQEIAVVFIATFGFVGIEYVSIQLDDPFGDDPNDLPVNGQARSVFQDIYLVMLDCDGLEAVNRLKSMMKPTENWSKEAGETVSLLV